MEGGAATCQGRAAVTRRMICNVGLKRPSLQGSASLKSPVLALLSAAFCLWLSILWILLGTGLSPRPAAQHCPEVLFDGTVEASRAAPRAGLGVCMCQENQR